VHEHVDILSALFEEAEARLRVIEVKQGETVVSLLEIMSGREPNRIFQRLVPIVFDLTRDVSPE
jgi:hypothetical protein